MFKWIKNLFKKEVKVEKAPSILFKVGDTSNEIDVEINVPKMDVETVKLFSRLMYDVLTIQYEKSLINLVQASFIQVGREDLYNIFMQEFVTIVHNEMRSLNTLEEEPIIKPSEALG